ncbi:Protein SOSEKI 1 [Vermiconidia calcicola]|uniref:Protein SOSEKI 1 n=1 Tax=Vermiconidia calcicola TaxID=1690605 RepID=A0ACC3NC31_9PEZI|nr:Protein SOSEKI 1 [Vermiconidia calcicola]
MYQQSTNHNIGVGEHAPASASSSQSFQPAAANGENSSATARGSRQAPVTSGVASQGDHTPDHGPPAKSAPAALPPKHESPLQEGLWFKWVEPRNDSAYHLIQNYYFPHGMEVAEYFRDASLQPPITRESLQELDMPRIINNPKLRHDVNFDRELHFRPNTDGVKGRQKQQHARDYWQALEGELFLYGLVLGFRSDSSQARNQPYWETILVGSRKRLPTVLGTIRDIIESLVPDCDQKAICDRLDVALIMQEIQADVCDLVDLGNWLAKVLKNHCAPMRDHMVDDMRENITEGASDETPRTLVAGICKLLNVLEAMKLDVANHQIRHMRPLLVEDTVNFQRKYNAHRISMNKIAVPRAKLWIECEMSAANTTSHLKGLTSGLLRGLASNESLIQFPQTFYLDLDRLRGLRADLHSHIFYLICRDTLLDMARQASEGELNRSVAAFIHTLRAVVGPPGRWNEKLNNIAVEIMRIVLELEKKDVSYDETLLDFIEQRLEHDLLPGSQAFDKHAQDLSDRLLPKIQASVDKNINVNALDLQNSLLAPLPPAAPQHPMGFGAVLTPQAALPQQPIDPDDDFIRRFTHIIVLHWQVWADLVYMAPSDDDSSDEEAAQTPTSSVGSEASTVPVARAIFGRGKHWLPIGITVEEVPSPYLTPSGTPVPFGVQVPSTETEEELNDADGEGPDEQSQIDSERQRPALHDYTTTP